MYVTVYTVYGGKHTRETAIAIYSTCSVLPYFWDSLYDQLFLWRFYGMIILNFNDVNASPSNYRLTMICIYWLLFIHKLFQIVTNLVSVSVSTYVYVWFRP